MDRPALSTADGPQKGWGSGLRATHDPTGAGARMGTKAEGPQSGLVRLTIEYRILGTDYTTSIFSVHEVRSNLLK